MNRVASIVSLIVIALVFIALGAGAGILYQIQKDAPQQDKLAVILKNLTSKAVPSIIVYGQVTNIDNRNLTLSFNGDSVIAGISDNASINSFVKDSKGLITQQKVDFSKIKNGDTLNISVKLLPDGQLQGDSVIILAP